MQIIAKLGFPLLLILLLSSCGSKNTDNTGNIVQRIDANIVDQYGKQFLSKTISLYLFKR